MWENVELDNARVIDRWLNLRLKDGTSTFWAASVLWFRYLEDVKEKENDSKRWISQIRKHIWRKSSHVQVKYLWKIFLFWNCKSKNDMAVRAPSFDKGLD